MKKALTSGSALLLLAAWLVAPQPARAATTAAPSDAAVAATLKRDSERCRTHSDLDACYDAVRRNPADASLSVALGDALLRAKRPADALRTYRRAALLAPNTPGLASKINALNGDAPAKRITHGQMAERAAVDRGSVKRFSNAAADGQSH